MRDLSAPHPMLCSGMFVKVGVRGERFWLRVQSVGVDGKIRAIVDSNLIRSTWQRGEEIMLQNEHVLETAHYEDQVSFHRLVAALGSQREAALTWHEARVVSVKCGQKRP